METTLYNHRLAGDGLLPLLPNLKMKEACEQIESGEKGVKAALSLEYSFAPAQESLLKWLENKYSFTSCRK